MMRWLATAVIGLLLLLDLGLPATSIGRRGTEAALRSDVAPANGRVGERLPKLGLQHPDGAPFDLASLRGHRVLLTFERSVDW